MLTFTPGTGGLPLSPDQVELLHPVRRQRYEREQSAVADGSKMFGRNQAALQMSAQLTLAFARAGGHLVLGSDPDAPGEGRVPGVSNHDSIKQAVRGVGFSPLQTIRMATLDGATFLGIQNRTGSISVGKEADLQVVKGAPDRDIGDVDNIEMVFANGIAYDPQLLVASVRGLVGSR